jgi:hypothetical protein
LPKSYSVARELQDRDDRFEIIKDNPNLTKREAVAIRQEREGKVPAPHQKKGTPDYMRKNSQRWFQRVYQLSNDINREVNYGGIEPELEEVFREVIEPALLPTIRDAGEALIKLADYLETVTAEDAAAETVSKTKRAKSKRAAKVEARAKAA